MQQISCHRSAAAWILQRHGLSPRSQCNTSFYACSKSLLYFKIFMGGHKGRCKYHVQNHKPSSCPLLFNDCLFWKHLKLASNQPLWHRSQTRHTLTRRLQLHLSCLSTITFTWATNIWITKCAPILGCTSAVRPAQITLSTHCLHKMQQPQSLLFGNLNSRDAVHAVVWLLQL